MARGTLPVIALLVLATSVAMAAKAPPEAACLRSKRLAAALAARQVLGCHARAAKRGQPVEPACLARAEARLLKAFERAERKAARRGACWSTDDFDAVWSTVAAFGRDAASAIGAGERSKCDTKKLKLIGSSVHRLLKAKAGAKHSLAVERLERAVPEVTRRLADGFAKAERRGDCGAGENAPALVSRVAQLAGVAGTLRGRLVLTKRIRLPEPSHAGVLAQRDALEARGLTLADDGSWLQGPPVAARGWLVRFGEAEARTTLDGEFTIDVSLGAPLVGHVFHPSSDTFEVGPIGLVELAGGADTPAPARFEIETQGPCGMNEPSQHDAPQCHTAPVGTAGLTEEGGPINPDPELHPPLVEEDGVTYPNDDPAATQIVCLDYDGHLPQDTRNALGFPGSLCFDRVVEGCCENESASVRRQLNGFVRNVPVLDARAFPGPVACVRNHGGGRFCQELRPGDVAVRAGAALITAGGAGLVDVKAGERRVIVVHNNGCYGRTHVARVRSPMPPLGGVLERSRFFDGATLVHYLGHELYAPDFPIWYQAPAECPESEPPATDTFSFAADGAVARLTLSCVSTTTTTSTSTSTVTSVTVTSTTATTTTLPGCFWSGSTDLTAFAALPGDYGEFFLGGDLMAVDSFVVARDESLGHPPGEVVASFVTLGDPPVPVGATGAFPVVLMGTLGAEDTLLGYTSLQAIGTGTTVSLTENDGDVLAGTVSGTVFLFEPLPDGRTVPFSLAFRIERDPLDSAPASPRCTVPTP